jgi:signal transduction histidine kinase
MSSDNRGPRPFGLRLGLWYATLFIIGSLVIVLLTYYLTASSLAQRDHQIIEQKLGEYAAVYMRGGTRALADLVSVEQRTAPERLFVRVIDRGVESVVISMPEGWDLSRLESVTRTLPGGTIVQVGKSTDLRLDLLARFRATLGLVTLSIVVVALTGGWLATQSALQPVRRLQRAVERIIQTGRTDERVTVAEHDDALSELTVLFNTMLDKIEGLVNGMRGALDNVSHDLRTPLARLRGAAELALMAPQVDVTRYREALADCVEETDRVLTMLNTLMDIAEAETGTMPLRHEPVALEAVVSRAVDLYRDVADAKGVTVAVDSLPHVVVFGDDVRLQQVAANLLDNAVKYTPSGGEVRVELGTRDGFGVLRVKDSGPGIPQDEQARIWERLFRGDRSRTERGLGLGLSLVKAVVEAHGGTVSVSSQPGHGATFEIVLPASSRSAA